jgi:hypothetical protein
MKSLQKKFIAKKNFDAILLRSFCMAGADSF